MNTERLVCPDCRQSGGFVRNGHTQSGAQIYRCKTCGKYFQRNFIYAGSTSGMSGVIMELLEAGAGCREITRTLGVGLNTVLRYKKKRQSTRI